MQKSVMTLSLLLSIYAPTHAMDLSVIHKCTADLAEIEKSEDPAALAREKYLTAQSLGCKNYNLLHAAVIAKKHNLITPLANAGFNTGSDAQCKYLLDYAIENNDLQSIDALLQHKKNIVIMDGSYSTSGCLLSAQTRIQPGTLMHLCKQIPNYTDFLRLKINCGKCIISTLSNDIKTLNECYEKGYLDSMLNDDDFSFDFQNWNLPLTQRSKQIQIYTKNFSPILHAPSQRPSTSPTSTVSITHSAKLLLRLNILMIYGKLTPKSKDTITTLLTEHYSERCSHR